MALPQVGLEAVIENLGSFSKGAATITKAYDQINTGSDKVAKKSGGLGSVFSGIGSGLATMGKLAAGAAVGGTAILGGAAAALGAQSIGMASDVAEAESAFDTTFGKAAPEARAELDEFAGAVGRNKYQLHGFSGEIGALLRPMGLTEVAAADMSGGFAGLAVDLSSFFNTSEPEALDALRSALIGESEPMRKFGVNINQAAIEQEALNSGLWDGQEPMDAATKAQATYALIMKQTTQAQGDALRTSGSWANQTRALSAAWDEFVVEVGQQLLPILTPLLQQFTSMAKEVLPEVVKWVKDNLPSAIQAAKDAWVEIQPVLDTIWKIITEDVIPAISDIVTWFKKDVPAGSAKVQSALKPVIDKVLPKLVEIFDVIQKWVVKNWPLIQKTIITVMDNIERKIRTVTKIIEYIWSNWGDEIKKAVELVFKIIKVNLENALDLVTLVMQLITGDWKGAWDTVKSIADRSLGLVLDIVKTSFDNILKIVTDIMGKVKDKISEIWSNIVTTVRTKTQEVYDKIKEKFDTFSGLISGYASKLLDAAKKMMDGVINGITSKATEIATTITTTISNAITTLRNSITSGTLYTTLTSVGQSIINKIKDGITAITDFGGKLISKIQEGINLLSSAISSGTLYNTLSNIGQKIINTIRDGVTSVTTFVSDIKAKLGEWFNGIISGSLVTSLKSTGKKIVEEIKNGFLGAENVFNLARDAIKDWILSWFSPIPEARYAGNEIVDNILLGFFAQRGKFIGATRAGLSDWIARAGMNLNPIIAPSVNAPSLGATGTTNIYNSYSLGGNTINSGMDAAQFETRVLRVIRKNL